jgi:hypothetical protein
MIEGLIAGKGYGRPEQRVGNNSGKPFVTAKVRAATSGGETLFVNVLAFDATVQAALLALSAWARLTSPVAIVASASFADSESAPVTELAAHDATINSAVTRSSNRVAMVHFGA